MPKIPGPLHGKRIPKSVSQPTDTAEAAATVAESVVAPVAKGAAKRAKPSAQPAASGANTAAPSKAARTPKPKLVRDSFTMPRDEYQVLDALKRRVLGLEKHVRKSELLRAGIQALAAMNDKSLLKAIGGVPTLKTGRPKAD